MFGLSHVTHDDVLVREGPPVPPVCLWSCMITVEPKHACGLVTLQLL